MHLSLHRSDVAEAEAAGRDVGHDRFHAQAKLKCCGLWRE
jgi:hypothetical protein